MKTSLFMHSIKKNLWRHLINVAPLLGLIVGTFAVDVNMAYADDALPSDTVLVAPKRSGARPIIAPIAGYNWHKRTDNPPRHGHPDEVPMYQNLERDSDDYWNVIVDELLLARVDLVLWHGRYCESLAPENTHGYGDMCPHLLKKFKDAATRAGAENILKAGYFDDTGNYPGAANVTHFDLANEANWKKYFWEHKMKIWFDTGKRSPSGVIVSR